jgi:polynucleotide 5'-hydroxyl-kinase GRC3/NOL9
MLPKKNNFFPFSPTFLSEYVGIDEFSDEEQPDVIEAEAAAADVRIHEQTDDDRPISVVAVVQDHQYVVGIRETETCFLSGFSTLTSLTDNLLLDGYLAFLNENVVIDRPVWTPAMKIWVNAGGNRQKTIVVPDNHKHRKKIRNAVKALQEASIDSPLTAFFLMEGIQDDLLRREDLFVQMEDINFCQLDSADSNLHPQYHQPILTAVSAQSISVHTALLASERFMTFRRLDVSRFPFTWLSIISDIMKPPRRPLRILICGAKGSGKSTFLKCLTNHCLFLLRKHKNRTLHVLDVDLGQPEMSPPGCIALHQITHPLLSAASHLHLRAPVASVFLGDITSKNEPSLYLAATRHLFQRYLNDCNTLYHPESTAANTDDEEDDRTTFNERNAVKLEPMCDMDEVSHHPILLINTDGFVRHLGADILAAVMEATRPTHIIHLQPRPTAANVTNASGGQRVAQERHRAAAQLAESLHSLLTQLVEQLNQSKRDNSLSLASNSLSDKNNSISINNSNNSGKVASNSKQTANKSFNVKSKQSSTSSATESISTTGKPIARPETILWGVDSAIYQPLRMLSAPELRHLRLVAYFLRPLWQHPNQLYWSRGAGQLYDFGDLLGNSNTILPVPSSSADKKVEDEGLKMLFKEVSSAGLFPEKSTPNLKRSKLVPTEVAKEDTRCSNQVVWDTLFQSSSDLPHRPRKHGLHIKNAVLQDPQQNLLLPMMLLHARCIRIPLADVVMQATAEEFQPSNPAHWLAAFNARLVGVTLMWEKEVPVTVGNSEEVVSASSNAPPLYQPLQLRLRQPLESTCHSGAVKPTVVSAPRIRIGGVLPPLSNCTHLLEGLGLGIVRAIDLDYEYTINNSPGSDRLRGAVYLICPALILHLLQQQKTSTSSTMRKQGDSGQPRCKVVLTLAAPGLSLPPHLTGISNSATVSTGGATPSTSSTALHNINNSSNHNNYGSISGGGPSVTSWPGHAYVSSNEMFVGEGSQRSKSRPNLKRRHPSSSNFQQSATTSASNHPNTGTSSNNSEKKMKRENS